MFPTTPQPPTVPAPAPVQGEPITDPDLASVNFFARYHLEGQEDPFDLQFTFRTTLTPGQLASFFGMAATACLSCLGSGFFPKSIGGPGGASIKISRPSATSAGDESFVAETVLIEDKTDSKGELKRYYKIKGHPFSDYGVRIWDEVLEEAGQSCGLDLLGSLASQTPGEHPLSANTWRCHFVRNDKGSVQKIVKLEKIA